MNLTVRPRNKGWQYILSYKSDTWHSVSKQGFRTKADAKRAGQIRMNELDVPVVSGITFKEVASLVEQDGAKSWNTLQSYKSWAGVYELIHDKPVNEISYQMVADIVFAYQKDHKHSGVRHIMLHGKRIMTYAVKKLKVINKNPFDDLVVKAPKVSDKTIKQALTLAELDKLINSLSGDIRAITAIMAYCGLRIGEARGLTRNDIVDGEITLHHQRIITGERGPLKSARSYRTIPMSKKMQAIYAGVAMPISKDTYIFPCYKSMTLIEAYEKEGFRITPHELRHSFTTNCISIGIDFKTTSQLIGDTVEMVYSVYSHVNVEMLEKAKKLLEDT